MTGVASTVFLFILPVGAGTLFYVSLLEGERLITALGRSTFVELFVLAFGLAPAPASAVLVSQSLGDGDRDLVARQRTSCIALTAAAGNVLKPVALTLLVGTLNGAPVMLTLGPRERCVS